MKTSIQQGRIKMNQNWQ